MEFKLFVSKLFSLLLTLQAFNSLPLLGLISNIKVAISFVRIDIKHESWNFVCVSCFD
jgi:hypothetical protein